MNSYVHSLTVPPTAIDGNGHVNNVVFVQWMQDAAVAHSDAAGCSALTEAAGCTWVAHTHHIEYLRPAFLGEAIEVRTRVADARRSGSLRKYEFHRPADGVLLARGETDWIYVDATSGRPRRIPAEIYQVFDLSMAN